MLLHQTKCCPPWYVVVADETAAMAVFSRHILVYIAVRGVGVMVVSEAVSPFAVFLPDTVEVCCSGGVTATAGFCTGTDGCVTSERKA